MAPSLAQPQAVRLFKISRVTTDPNSILDPCPGFDFIPPRDSDELYDALRAAYPKGRTHRERMMEAVLDFIAHETSLISAEKTRGVDATFQPNLQPAQKGSAQRNIRSTKPGGDRKSIPTGPSASASKQAGKKRPWQKMTSSWNSTVGSSPARPREPMTTQQRHEYRIRRGIGACESCRRRKKKCTHQPLEDENASIATASTVLVECGKSNSFDQGLSSSETTVSKATTNTSNIIQEGPVPDQPIDPLRDPHAYQREQSIRTSTIEELHVPQTIQQEIKDSGFPDEAELPVVFTSLENYHPWYPAEPTQTTSSVVSVLSGELNSGYIFDPAVTLHAPPSWPDHSYQVQDTSTDAIFEYALGDSLEDAAYSSRSRSSLPRLLPREDDVPRARPLQIIGSYGVDFQGQPIPSREDGSNSEQLLNATNITYSTSSMMSSPLTGLKTFRQRVQPSMMRINDLQRAKLIENFMIEEYPSDEGFTALATSTGLDRQTVKSWFKHERRIRSSSIRPAASLGLPTEIGTSTTSRGNSLRIVSNNTETLSENDFDSPYSLEHKSASVRQIATVRRLPPDPLSYRASLRLGVKGSKRSELDGNSAAPPQGKRKSSQVRKPESVIKNDASSVKGKDNFKLKQHDASSDEMRSVFDDMGNLHIDAEHER